MSFAECCNARELSFTQRVVDRQYADICYCVNCGHVHATERYPVPLKLFPPDGRCVDCGGKLAGDRCGNCKKLPASVKKQHHQYAKLHPSGSFLNAAMALADLNRHTLALKLASAEVVWGEEPVLGMVVRLQTLDALNELDRALDEAYEWANSDAPLMIWGILADLEAAAGNIPNAMRNLERGLNLDPENVVWWTDYAEMQVHLDDRGNAIRAAKRGLEDPETQERSVRVIAEVGERYYANGQSAEALGACSVCGNLQEQYEDLAWLRARICASQEDREQTVKWLTRVLELNPTNDQAKLMYDSFAPKKQSGWFW